MQVNPNLTVSAPIAREATAEAPARSFARLQTGDRQYRYYSIHPLLVPYLSLFLLFLTLLQSSFIIPILTSPFGCPVPSHDRIGLPNREVEGRLRVSSQFPAHMDAGSTLEGLTEPLPGLFPCPILVTACGRHADSDAGSVGGVCCLPVGCLNSFEDDFSAVLLTPCPRSALQGSGAGIGMWPGGRDVHAGTDSFASPLQPPALPVRSGKGHSLVASSARFTQVAAACITPCVASSGRMGTTPAINSWRFA
jgi:hypothetical protein